MQVKAHGKLNLSLDILGRRDNGYHDVSMVMQSVELHDVVTVNQNTTGLITVKTNHPDVPEGKENLVYKACELMRDTFDLSCGFDVFIEKNIPIAGGMAGGSTDAAAVMRAVRTICDLPISTKGLMELGLSLGADVPFCIYERPALATGIGEVITPICGLPASLWILLVNPRQKISTKIIYDLVDKDMVYHTVDNASLITALKNGDISDAVHYMKNVMQITSASLCREILNTIEHIKKLGAMHAMMSGSGATCFGIFDTKPDIEEAKKMFPDYYVALTKPLSIYNS